MRPLDCKRYCRPIAPGKVSTSFAPLGRGLFWEHFLCAVGNATSGARVDEFEGVVHGSTLFAPLRRRYYAAQGAIVHFLPATLFGSSRHALKQLNTPVSVLRQTSRIAKSAARIGCLLDRGM